MGYDPRPFIASMTWRFAVTMPENPHWYVVERDSGSEAYTEFLAFIATMGRIRKFNGYPYRYVTVDDHDYWTTWASSAGTLINRKPSATAGWDPE